MKVEVVALRPDDLHEILKFSLVLFIYQYFYLIYKVVGVSSDKQQQYGPEKEGSKGQDDLICLVKHGLAN